MDAESVSRLRAEVRFRRSKSDVLLDKYSGSEESDVSTHPSPLISPRYVPMRLLVTLPARRVRLPGFDTLVSRLYVCWVHGVG